MAELVEEPLVVLGPSHGTRRLLDAAVAAGGWHYRLAAETNVPQVAQALAAGGRGVAVVSDDPRYGLVPLAIMAGDRTARGRGRWTGSAVAGGRGVPGSGAGELRIPLVAAWDPSHYASDAIEALVASLADYVAERYER